jgi:regulator of PEP synthase PpsR (kinase-PPPase family)
MTESFFHLHLVSDATGETLLTVSRAAAAQYAQARPIEHVFPLVRTAKQLEQVLTEIEDAPGIVLYTLLDPELSRVLEERCREVGSPCINVLDPVHAAFQSYLGVPTTRRAGAQHTLDAAYFRRIEALNFSMMHDDGQHAENLEEADVILVGVSRTSKTPTSIYLANRGVKVANVPLVPNVPPPQGLVSARKPLVVGLYASVERIVQVRQNRMLAAAGELTGSSYTDHAAVAEEVAHARRFCARHGWPMIDVTRRSIEETATAILALLQKRRYG